MFERNKIDNSEAGAVSVELVLQDATVVVGRIVVPMGKSVFDLLNGTGLFIELADYNGTRQFLSKASVRSARMTAPPRAPNLPARLKELDGFDPHAILGVTPQDPWENIRAAFVRLSKTYHPDRYATAELPAEVKAYLDVMARRVNAAFQTLEADRASSAKPRPAAPASPVYTSSRSF